MVQFTSNMHLQHSVALLLLLLLLLLIKLFCALCGVLFIITNTLDLDYSKAVHITKKVCSRSEFQENFQ